MNIIYKIKRLFRNVEIQNLMTYVSFTMAAIFVGNMMTDGQIVSFLSFDRSLILEGQVWRIITFLLLPQTGSVFWIFFSVMFYYYTGRLVEEQWGSHNLTMYFLTGAVLLIATGFITGYADSSYLYFSLFLVYAYFNPRNQLRIMFLIPIEVRWVALVDIVFMLVDFFKAFAFYIMPLSAMKWLALGMQLSVLSAFGTFAIFFGGAYIARWRNKIKHKDFIAEMKRNKIKASKRDEDDR